MIIARADNEDGSRKRIVFALSAENIRRLQNFEPITLDENHPQAKIGALPPGWSIMIMFGDTEQAIKKQFEDAGLIGPETKIHVDPRLT